MQIKHTPTSFTSGYALGLEQTQRTHGVQYMEAALSFEENRSTHIDKLSNLIGRERNKLGGQVAISFFYLQWAMNLLQFVLLFSSPLNFSN